MTIHVDLLPSEEEKPSAPHNQNVLVLVLTGVLVGSVVVAFIGGLGAIVNAVMPNAPHPGAGMLALQALGVAVLAFVGLLLSFYRGRVAAWFRGRTARTKADAPSVDVDAGNTFDNYGRIAVVLAAVIAFQLVCLYFELTPFGLLNWIGLKPILFVALLGLAIWKREDILKFFYQQDWTHHMGLWPGLARYFSIVVASVLLVALGGWWLLGTYGLNPAGVLTYWKGFSLSGLPLGLAWYWWVLMALAVGFAILAWRDSDRLVEWAGSEGVYTTGILLSSASTILLVILALCGMAHFFVDLPFNAWDYGKWVILALMAGAMLVTVSQSIEHCYGWKPIATVAIVCGLLVGIYIAGNGLYGWWQAPEKQFAASTPTAASSSVASKDGKQGGERVASIVGAKKGTKTTAPAPDKATAPASPAASKSPAPAKTTAASPAVENTPAPGASPAATKTTAPAPAVSTNPVAKSPVAHTTLVVKEFKAIPAPDRILKRETPSFPFVVGSTTYDDRDSLTSLEQEVKDLATKLGKRASLAVNTGETIKLHNSFELAAYIAHLEQAKAVFTALDHPDVTVVGSTLRAWQTAQVGTDPPFMGHTRFATTVKYRVPLQGGLSPAITIASATISLGFTAQMPALS